MRSHWKLASSAACSALLAALLVGAVVALLLPGSHSHAEDPFLRRTATVHVVEQAGPAVVNITTERVVSSSPFRSFFRSGNPLADEFFRDFFAPHRARSETVESLGSGVIIDETGHVLTNEHVVARASRIRVTLADGREFNATLVGADPNNDLAVLRIEHDGVLPFIVPGTSSDLLVGEPVIAIGNPFGLSNTVTTGVISAIDRSIRANERTFHGFLQTDASINPGNSGGPLLNAEGTLIGVNTAIYNGAQGIGFAIPIDVARRVVAELLEHGEVQPVWTGLEFQDLDPELQEVMALPDGVFGAIVTRVEKDGPGDRAGVRRGDVVTRLDGRPVQTARAYYEMLGAVTDDQILKLEVWRDGSARDVTLRAEQIPDEQIPALAERYLGMKLRNPGEQAGGFVIASVRGGSAAEQIGFQRGDRMLAINGRPLRDDADLRRAVLDLRGRSRTTVVVQRGNARYNVTIPIT